MKKYAFTLAETLMTMAIIGVCAAMLITTIKNVNPTKQADAIMAKKAVTIFSDATKQLMIHHAKSYKMDDLGYTTTAANGTKTRTACGNDATCVFNLYGKYIQISEVLKGADVPTGLQGSIFGRLTDGLVFGLKYDNACKTSGTIYTTPAAEEASSNTAPSIAVSNTCGIIYYDVNGKKGPNVDGKDRFALPIFRSTGVRLPSVTATK